MKLFTCRSAKEEGMLRDGVAQFGVGKWTAVSDHHLQSLQYLAAQSICYFFFYMHMLYYKVSVGKWTAVSESSTISVVFASILN
jgi:hypothetical protein